MVRILLVDDYEVWRSQVHLPLQVQPELQLICEVPHGLESIQKADEQDSRSLRSNVQADSLHLKLDSA